MKIVLLAGGVGAARFLEGLVNVINPSDLTVIVNTGDDEEFYGLHVCPDIDTIIYTLSGNGNPSQGWGLRNETFTVYEQLKRLGNDTWFTLGDKDLATHLHRTNLLKRGKTLSQVTTDLAGYFSLPFTLLPMSNDSVRTRVTTPAGTIPFQEYFVKRRFADEVLGVQYSGIENATPAPGVLEAIEAAEAIIIAPSNPLVSIGTILAVSPIRENMKVAKAKKIAISPIVGGKAIKGPADKMFRALHMNPSALGVAKYYHDLLNVFIIDNQDMALKKGIEKLGLSVVTTNTIMKDSNAKKSLARKVMESLAA